MQSRINRRDFLKLGMLALSSLAFRPYFIPGEQPSPDLWGRVTIEEIEVYAEPRSDVSLIVGKRYRDQGWQEQYCLYYETTHWVTGMKKGQMENRGIKLRTSSIPT